MISYTKLKEVIISEAKQQEVKADLKINLNINQMINQEHLL